VLGSGSKLPFFPSSSPSRNSFTTSNDKPGQSD
jgi:hypothetical protein